MSEPKNPSKKQQKKQAIRERNKKHLLVNLMAWRQEDDDARQREVDPESIKRKEAKQQEVSRQASDQPGTEVWSAKLHDVRNKITGKKRKSRERWNRFSGTSDAGARGK